MTRRSSVQLLAARVSTRLCAERVIEISVTNRFRSSARAQLVASVSSRKKMLRDVSSGSDMMAGVMVAVMLLLLRLCLQYSHHSSALLYSWLYSLKFVSTLHRLSISRMFLRHHIP